MRYHQGKKHQGHTYGIILSPPVLSISCLNFTTFSTKVDHYTSFHYIIKARSICSYRALRTMICDAFPLMITNIVFFINTFFIAFYFNFFTFSFSIMHYIDSYPPYNMKRIFLFNCIKVLHKVF